MRFFLQVSLTSIILSASFSLATNSTESKKIDNPILNYNKTGSLNETVIKQQPVNVTQELHKQNYTATTEKGIIVIEGGEHVKLSDKIPKEIIKTNETVNVTVESSTHTPSTTTKVRVKAMEGGSINITSIKNVNQSQSANAPETKLPKHEDENEKSEMKGKISPRKGVEEETTKKISARKGVDMQTTKEEIHITSTTTTTHKPKPHFTMMTGDKLSKGSESFIESPTTGRDYVLPIVLVILGCPALVYLIKFLYKRGTEFTERQQYHRMYLIDEPK